MKIMIKHMMSAALLSAALIGSLAASAQAQSYNNRGDGGTYTTMPLGGGWYMTTGPNGGTYTTMPLGGGWSTTTGPNGYNSTTMPLGGGWSTTTVHPGYRHQSDDEDDE